MANEKIADLTPDDPPVATDRIPIARSPFALGDNGYLTPDGLLDYVSLHYTRAEIATATIPASVDVIRTTGYATAGDGGGAVYKRVVGEPSHNLKVQSADTAWWELIPQNNQLNILAAGAVADDATDCYTAINNCINYTAIVTASSTLPSNYDIVVPVGKYYCATGLQLKVKVRLLGSGSGTADGAPCQIRFPVNVTGIQVHRSDTTGATTAAATTGADGTEICGIDLKSTGGTVANVTDRTKGHGIDLRERAIIKNCSITAFPGNGINIVATAGGAANVQGNANGWRIEGARIITCLQNGVFVDGADTNAGIGIAIDIDGCDRWGVNDSSFLGNTWISCQTANCGIGASPSVVSYSGDRYHAVPSATEADYVATTPGTDATIWRYYLPGAGSSPAWTASQPSGTFKAGGPYYTDDSNVRSIFLGCYEEGGQGFVWMASRSVFAFGNSELVIGGSGLSTDTGVLIATKGYTANETSVGTAAGQVMNAQLGGDANAGYILSWTGQTAAADDWGGTWALRAQDANFVCDINGSGANVAFILTGESTTKRKAYKFGVNDFILGTESNGRLLGRPASDAHPTSGVYVRGDMYLYSDLSPGGYVGFVCTTGGTAGVDAVFNDFGYIGVPGTPGGSDTQIQLNNAGAFGGSYLWQGSNVINQKNTTNAQKFILTMTDDGAGNYRRGFLNATGGYFIIDTESAGTGASVNVLLRAAGNNAIELDGANINIYQTIKPSTTNTYALGTAANAFSNGFFGGYIRCLGKTVANLVAAATAGVGARDFVTDALSPVFGSAVTGGGAVNVPVYCDGSGWLVG